MGKMTAFKDVKFGIQNVILSSSEVFMPSSLENISNPETIITLTKRNLEGIKNLTRSLETMMRYHQGKAVREAKIQGITLNLTKYESDLTERVYGLFLDYEWLLAYYHERPLQIEKLTFL